jgi:hypothetical protein
MKKDIEHYLKECDESQRGKRTNEYGSILADVREARFPFDVKCLHITSPYAETPRKIRYILTFLDHISRYAEAIPGQNILPNMWQGIREPCDFTSRVGIMASYRPWKQFHLEFFREVFKIQGVKQITTTAYHPQTNGALERYHKPCTAV